MLKLLLLGALLATPALANEETTPIVETLPQYTLIKEEVTYTLTLLNETECKITYGEKEVTGTYVQTENGVVVVINNDPYTLILNEDGTFEEVEEVNEIWTDFKTWCESWLTPQTLTSILSVATTVCSVIALAVKMLRMAKEKNLTVEYVRNELNATLGDKVDSTIKEELNKSIPSLVKTINNQKELISVLCKVVALAQENSPQSRIAIIELISKIGVDTSSEKAAIENEIASNEIKKEETNERLDKIINEK